MAWMDECIDPNVLKQGSIVDNVGWGLDDDEPLGIVLSNPCDLEHSKASFILIASLIDAKLTLQNSKEFLSSTTEGSTVITAGQKKNLLRTIHQYIHNVNIGRYFFVDPNNVLDAPPMFIDFQHLITKPIEYTESLEIVAEVKTPFIEKIVVNFASYVSRIGVDRIVDVQRDKIAAEMLSPFDTTS